MLLFLVFGQINYILLLSSQSFPELRWQVPALLITVQDKEKTQSFKYSQSREFHRAHSKKEAVI